MKKKNFALGERRIPSDFGNVLRQATTLAKQDTPEARERRIKLYSQRAEMADKAGKGIDICSGKWYDSSDEQETDIED